MKRYRLATKADYVVARRAMARVPRWYRIELYGLGLLACALCTLVGWLVAQV